MLKCYYRTTDDSGRIRVEEISFVRFLVRHAQRLACRLWQPARLRNYHAYPRTKGTPPKPAHF